MQFADDRGVGGYGRTVLWDAMLAEVKVRLACEKPHEAELGNEPQAKIKAPAKPLTGTIVSLELPVAPCVIVRTAGWNAALIEGGIALMATVCADETTALKLLSPL